MDDLITFTTARLDEDEAAAKLAASPSLHDLSWTAIDHPPSWAIVVDSASDLVAKAQPERSHDSAIADHIARHDPARVLREVAAKRRLIEHHGTWDDPTAAHHDECVMGDGKWPCFTMTTIAAVWSDHPDYKPEWKTDGT